MLTLALAPSHRIRSVEVPSPIAAQIAELNGVFDTTLLDVASAHDVVLLASCGLRYTAAEHKLSRHTNGVFTHYLLRILAQPPPPTSANELLVSLKANMYEFGQEPELHGRIALFTEPFLAREVAEGALSDSVKLLHTGIRPRWGEAV